MRGDCLERMKEIPDGSIDLILTDPPYGITACKWDSVIPLEPMWDQIWRVLKPNGACALFGSEPFSSHLRMSQVGRFKYDWIWHKTSPKNFINAKKQPLRSHEIISIFYKKQCFYNPQGLVFKEIDNSRPNHLKRSIEIYSKQYRRRKDSASNYPRSIIKCSNPNKGSVHPTQKPTSILEYLIKTYTLEGETVLDFTMGSGSTGVACQNLNRKFIGIEKDDKYFEIAKKRLQDKRPRFKKIFKSKRERP